MTVPADAGAVLLPLARAAIGRAVGVADWTEPALPAWTAEPGAAFVTLTLDGRLRGCIGSLTAHRSLADDVRHNARAAALDDPRFPALTREEAYATGLEVSVLGEPEPVAVASEDEAVAALRPGVDGVILEALGRRATYLPQVWDQLPDPADFLRSLRRKAGVPPDHWGDDVRLSRYAVTAWEEERS